MALYDELYSTLTKRRGTSFLRQVNQLRTLHELHEKELKETELKEAGQRIARKQDLLIFILSISVVLLILLYVLFLYYRHPTILEEPVAAGERVAFGISKTVDKGKDPCGRG